MGPRLPLAFVAVFALAACQPEGNRAASDAADEIAVEAVEPPALVATASRLDGLYQAFVASGGTEDCRTFFRSLPTSADAFRALYGYQDGADDVVYGPLYDRDDHVRTPFDPSCVGADSLARWATGIATEAEWQADNVNHFQDALARSLAAEPAAYCRALGGLAVEEAESMWLFLFSGPDPPSAIPDSLTERLRATCPDQLDVAQRGLDRAEAEWKGH